MELELLLIQITEIFHKSIDAYKKKVIRESGFSDLTLSQLFYLEAIFQLGRPTLTELSRHLNISKASTTTGVQKLIRMDLAEKKQSEADKRVSHVHLSEKGRQLITAEVNALTDFSEKIKQTLDDTDKKDLARLFEKIIAGHQV